MSTKTPGSRFHVLNNLFPKKCDAISCLGRGFAGFLSWPRVHVDSLETAFRSNVWQAGNNRRSPQQVPSVSPSANKNRAKLQIRSILSLNRPIG